MSRSLESRLLCAVDYWNRLHQFPSLGVGVNFKICGLKPPKLSETSCNDCTERNISKW
ncbi:hypothetical protein SRHO_G00261510 [Serrasalmus rhombeus]